MTDLHVISELHATLPGLSQDKVREKVLQCTMELSGEDDNCTALMFRVMDVAIQDGDVHDYLGRKLKKLVDSL